MLKIVYPICCGVDVHKRFIIATIATTNDENITSYLTKRFDTYTEDLVAFKDWLLEHNCKLKLLSPIPNTSRPSAVKKLIRKTLFGLLTYSSMI